VGSSAGRIGGSLASEKKTVLPATNRRWDSMQNLMRNRRVAVGALITIALIAAIVLIALYSGGGHGGGGGY
jgi:hypothetical protein